MKFRVDICAGARVKAWLEELGHEALLSLELGPDPGDAELLAYAASENMCVVALDRGFAESVFTHGTASTGVLFLPDLQADTQKRRLADALARHLSDLELKRWVIATPGNFRVRGPQR